MALEHLLAALEREAAERAQALIAGARAESDRIAAAAEERVTRRRRETLGPREAALRATAERTLAETRRAARRAQLEARGRLLDRVFAAARELGPPAVAGDAYRRALPAFLAQALACVGAAPAVIRCSPALARPIRALVATLEREGLTVEPDARVGSGFVLTTGDGKISVDHTLEARLARAESRLALEALRALDLAAAS